MTTVDVPVDLWPNILDFIDTLELLVASTVCRTWRWASDCMWNRRLEQRYGKRSAVQGHHHQASAKHEYQLCWKLEQRQYWKAHSMARDFSSISDTPRLCRPKPLSYVICFEMIPTPLPPYNGKNRPRISWYEFLMDHQVTVTTTRVEVPGFEYLSHVQGAKAWQFNLQDGSSSSCTGYTWSGTKRGSLEHYWNLTFQLLACSKSDFDRRNVILHELMSQVLPHQHQQPPTVHLLRVTVMALASPEEGIVYPVVSQFFSGFCNGVFYDRNLDQTRSILDCQCNVDETQGRVSKSITLRKFPRPVRELLR